MANETPTAPAPAAHAPAASPAAERKPRRRRAKVTHARGKRKEAIARATLTEGKGRVTVNRVSLDAWSHPLLKQVVREPLAFAGAEGVDTSAYDIAVTVRGGGIGGQAQAARTAIARALVAHASDKELRQKMIAFDRSLLVEDPRRVEPKKFKGPKARARFTKSYR
jgi:small subunit ribosomal protein S9